MISFLSIRIKITSLIIVLSLFISLFFLRNGINVNNSLDIWFVQNDTVYENYIDFRNRYANDEAIAIYVKSGVVFSPEVLGSLIGMCNQFDSLSFVKSVFSIANAPYISNTFFGPVVSPLISSPPKSQQEANTIKEKVNRIPHYTKTLIDKAQKGFMVYVMIKPENGESNTQIVNSIRKIAYDHFQSIHFGGIPIINESLNETAASESRTLSFLSILAVVVFLVLFLRNWRYVIISVLSVLIPVIWLFGAFTALGGSFNMITVVVPTILLITGTATSIHIINICHRFYTQESLTKNEALKKALTYVFWPSFFTATTTMAGFASLTVSSIEGIKETGILAAAGVGLVFIASFVVTAIAFLVLPASKNSSNDSNEQLSPKTLSVLKFFSEINRRMPKLAIILIPATILLSFLFINKIDVGTHAFDYINKHSTTYIDNDIIEKSVGPYLPVEILISSDSTFSAADLHKIYEFQKLLETRVGIANLFSPLDLMAYLYSSIQKSDSIGLPQGKGTTEWVKNLYLKNRSKNFQKYDNEDFSEIRLSGNTYIGSSSVYQNLSNAINNAFTHIFSTDESIKLSIRGYLPMYVAMNNYIISGQIKTFVIAFILILVLIIISFKSLKLALMALLPNLLPVSMVIITMALLKIPMDQSTALITCVILGIAFDDSIHLIYAYQKHKRKGLDSPMATQKALETTSSAMISTSIALFAGFAIISTLSATGLFYFGLLCSIAVVGSFIGNFWLFPLMLKKA
jgi:uncharacterized protein